jgi:chemotaxis protein MotB
MHEDRFDDDDDNDLGGSPSEPADTWLLSYADLLTNLLVFFVLLISASHVSSVEFERVKDSLQKESKTPSENSMTQVYESLNQTVNSHQRQEEIKVEKDDRSIAISFPGKVLFDLGKSEVKPEVNEMMKEIAAALQNIPDYARIAIEGHTDDNPVQGNGVQSNWHLSALRAVNVLQYLDQLAVCKGKCEIRGFGETMPVAENRNSTGAKIATNQALNRRVVIRVY